LEREREQRSGGFQTHLAEKRSWSHCFDFQADSTEEPRSGAGALFRGPFFFALLCFVFQKIPTMLSSLLFSLKIDCMWRGHANEAGRERKKKEVGRGERNDEFFLVIYEFAEELQCSANLLSTVAPHHFVEGFVEPAG
jgi:hypothetical protein